MVDIPLTPIAQTISIREHPYTGTWMKINHDPNSPINTMLNMLTAKDNEMKAAIARAEKAEEQAKRTCTCDDHCDSPCPAHARENELQDLWIAGKVGITAAVALLEQAPCDCPEWESGIGMFHEHRDDHAPCFKNKANALIIELRKLL